MPFKTLLTVVDVEQSDIDINAAIELCAEVGGHLSILVLARAAPPPVGEFAAVISESWLRERRQDEVVLAERTQQINALAAQSGVPFEVSSHYTEDAWVDDTVARRARYADLTIVGPELAQTGDFKRRVLNGVLFEAGRPVFIVPQAGKASLHPRTVLVAWNGKDEALRAVRTGRALLTQADAVHVTMIDAEEDEGEGAEPGTQIATYLARQGAKVTIDRLPSLGKPTFKVLTRHALDISADLVLMGAYSHSRLRQRIFGGVTRSVIETAPLPFFLAH